jgi:alanyl-tRNA synthetase
MYTHNIRSTFLKFFQKNSHQIISSSSLVPQNDPSLMFTNSGMVQFKNVFTGLESRPYTTATTAQKCVRAGGKHNDLENVGYTARHHTFFEMLGNFSFGDYFKEEAITYAWNLLTHEFKLSKDKLYITVFSEDDEAFHLWKKIAGFPDHKIIRIPTSDNFWSMGDTGPCGPCTEIFYDHGEHIPGGLPGSADAEGDRFVEIWNLVFMQYEQQKDGSRILLPKASVDTGMGLERIAAVLQGVTNNYDTDVLKSLVVAVAEKTSTSLEGEFLVSQRVIADHLRASCFLIADGVLPSNEGRGYVLRRIMRRAMRHAYMLKTKEPLLCQLVPFLIEKMGEAYPELERARDLITLTLRLEEERFSETFARGLRVLEEEVSNLGGQMLSGQAAFKLYDTYGFPLDLTEDILKSRRIHVNLEEFNQFMQRQRETARASWVGSGDNQTESLWFDLWEKCGATEFVGYHADTIEASILALVKDGKQVSTLNEGEKGFLIVNQTSFYGESGGQMGDEGTFFTLQGRGIITNTLKKIEGLFIHETSVKQGQITVGDQVTLKIDKERRIKLRANHSATHLLHEALRRVLGSSVTQKGSLVAPERLRFDFSYPQPVSKEILYQVEKDINAQIRGNALVSTRISSPEAAMKAGAQALFGEKYGDEVRVVSMGHEHDVYSVELCGGTHVERLGDIGAFKILSESSVSSGVRRIEAITGAAVEEYMHHMETVLGTMADQLKSSVKALPERVEALVEDRKKLERALRTVQSSQGVRQGEESLETVNGISLLVYRAKDLPSQDLKSLMDTLKRKLGSGIILLTSVTEDKATALIGVTENLITQYSAKELISPVIISLGGKGGGGRPDLAQGGGLAHHVESAIQKLREILAS